MPAGVEVKLEPEDEEFEEELMTTGLQLAGGELAHMCLVVSHLVRVSGGKSPGLHWQRAGPHLSGGKSSGPHVSGGKSSGTCVWW